MGDLSERTTRIELEAQIAVRFPVSLQILDAVFQPDFVGFQEAIELVPGFEAQEAPKLSCRKLSLAVGFQSEGLENASAKAPAPALSEQRKAHRECRASLASQAD
jgi:hypothetical protein